MFHSPHQQSLAMLMVHKICELKDLTEAFLCSINRLAEETILANKAGN